jgi:hypothetical protein
MSEESRMALVRAATVRGLELGRVLGKIDSDFTSIRATGAMTDVAAACVMKDIVRDLRKAVRLAESIDYSMSLVEGR